MLGGGCRRAIAGSVAVTGMCGCAICTLLRAKRRRQFGASKEVNSKVNTAQAQARQRPGKLPEAEAEAERERVGCPACSALLCFGGEPRGWELHQAAM